MTDNDQTQVDEELGNYELTMIVSPEAAEETFEAIIDGVSRYVTENGGTVSEVDRWGKRRLAYPIGQFGEGQYVLTRFQLRPEHNHDLEANLRISEDVIRHLLVKLD